MRLSWFTQNSEWRTNCTRPRYSGCTSFFASVFTNEDPSVPEPTAAYSGPEEDMLNNIVIAEEEVKKRLEKLDASKAAGPDDLPPSLLKELASVISRPKPIAIIFNKSLDDDESIVPGDWRVANISPIFKKGSRASTGNYQPISLTSVIGKLLKGIIKEKIINHLDQHNLINPTQHGFMKGKSCTTNLLLLGRIIKV